jgi:predicted PurR-regulated permease PerM
VIGLVLLALALALITAPVRRLARHVGSGAATALNALLTFVAVVGMSALVLRDLQGQADRLANELIDAIHALRPGSQAAHFADVVDAEQSIDRVLGRLPGAVVAGEDTAVGIGRQASICCSR